MDRVINIASVKYNNRPVDTRKGTAITKKTALGPIA